MSKHRINPPIPKVPYPNWMTEKYIEPRETEDDERTAINNNH